MKSVWSNMAAWWSTRERKGRTTKSLSRRTTQEIRYGNESEEERSEQETKKEEEYELIFAVIVIIIALDKERSIDA